MPKLRQNNSLKPTKLITMKVPFLIISFFVASSVCAQSSTSSFDVDGIKVIYKPTVKEIINVSMYFRGGVSNYASSKAGIEDMALSATAECGTKKYNKNKFKDIEDEYGINVVGGSEYDYGAIRLNCLSKYFNQGWDLFSEAINNPTFDARELELIKTKLVSAIKSGQSQPDKYIEDMAVKSAYQNTAYAYPPAGTEATIGNFTQQDIINYYKQILNKNQLFLVVVGKISKEELVQKIRTSFASLPAKPYAPKNLQLESFVQNALVTEDRELATNYIMGIMNAPKMTSEDYVPYRLAISILSGRLFNEIRTKKNLSYDPGAITTNLLMPYANMSVSTTDPKAAVAIMVEQVKRLKNTQITEESLNYLKGSYITNNYMKQESSAAIASNLGLAEIMGNWQLADELTEKVQAATPKQIQQAAINYISGIRWAYLGNVAQAQAASKEFNLVVY